MTVTVKTDKVEEEINKEIRGCSIMFYVIALVVLFIGTLMMILGIVAYSHYHTFSFFYASAKSGHFVAPSLIFLIVGVSMNLVWIFGVYGTVKLNSFMVNLFALFLTLSLILELVVVVLSLTANGNKILEHINIPINYYATEPEIQAEIDYMQSQLRCCGDYSFKDYIGVEFTSDHGPVSVAVQDENGVVNHLLVPNTCCVTNNNPFCTRIWLTGCREAVVSKIMSNATLLAVLGFAIMTLNAQGIALALIMARSIRKIKTHRAVMFWNYQEQKIMTREAEKQKKMEQNQAHIDKAIAMKEQNAGTKI